MTREAIIIIYDFVINVFHHHPGQPITLVSFPWHDQLLSCIFNFIAIKQGTYVRRALI
jgi:hypothetical protein